MNGIMIVVEKIQRYIYQRMDERRAEWQHDEKTLQDIIWASNAVSEEILNKIKEKFDVNEKNTDKVLLWVSGKVVFFTGLEQGAAKQKLKELHKEIYMDYGGNIQLSYAVFEQDFSEDKMLLLKKAKRALDCEKKKNTFIIDAADWLFQFQELKNPTNNKTISLPGGIFAKDMDDLVVRDEKHISNSTDGKIAIVKADINNMGRIFDEIEDYKEYRKLSALLKERISVKHFACAVGDYEKMNLKEKILPFYIEGDDIFYAVRIDALLSSIDMLHKIIKEINVDIKNGKELGIAVGVIFTNNHQPIRYYREMVERELSVAKKCMKTKKAGRVDLGVSIDGNQFYGYRGILGTGESDGFLRFVREIEELKWLKKEKIFTDSWIYNLLEALEQEEEQEVNEAVQENENIGREQLRKLLYFMIPDTKKTEQSGYELFFKYYLLSQVLADSQKQEDTNKNQDPDNTNKHGEKSFEPDKISSVLIPKLKLITLFTDKRFVCLDIEENFGFEKIISKARYSDQLRRVMSTLFAKPLNEICEGDLSEGAQTDMEKLFAKKETIPVGEKSGRSGQRKRITVYKKAPLHVAVLFRIKQLMEQRNKESINLTENLVVNYFEQNRATVEKSKIERKIANKIEYRKDFRVDEFKKYFDKFKKSDNFGIQWIDNLILFYKYDEQRIKRKAFREYLSHQFKEIVVFKEKENGNE